jgi:hypothetical protein
MIHETLSLSLLKNQELQVCRIWSVFFFFFEGVGDEFQFFFCWRADLKMICKLQFQEEKASCPEGDLDRFADMPATSDFLFHMRALI